MLRSLLQDLASSGEAPGPRLAAESCHLDLLFAAQSRQEPVQNAIFKLCHHPSSPKSDFEQRSQENARFLLPRATPKGLPKPSQIEKSSRIFRKSLHSDVAMSPKPLSSCPQPASKANLRRFLDHFGSILEAFLEAFSSQLVTSNLLPLAFSL